MSWRESSQSSGTVMSPVIPPTLAQRFLRFLPRWVWKHSEERRRLSSFQFELEGSLARCTRHQRSCQAFEQDQSNLFILSEGSCPTPDMTAAKEWCTWGGHDDLITHRRVTQVKLKSVFLSSFASSFQKAEVINSYFQKGMQLKVIYSSL